LKVQIAAVNFIIVPFATRNFKSAVAVGDCCHRRKTPPAFRRFPATKLPATAAFHGQCLAKHVHRRRVRAQHHAARVQQQRRPCRALQTEYNFRFHSNQPAHRSLPFFCEIQGMTNARWQKFPHREFPDFGQRAAGLRPALFAPGAYSASNCRHAPHGIGPRCARHPTATATNFSCRSSAR